ncbi:hypothetical protein [Streptomyces sp. TP-A0356]|uniref:hypothetical protein n=1 Tax=Streptomyces sp. TP-A0356 TaxID=1359208 RepID=UPI0006E13195|nr:hypothetical protein [Streptomyces sp. TP-A0356]
MNRPKVIAITACGLTVLSVTAATVDHVSTHTALAAARRQAAAADHRAQQAASRPAKVVTKTVDKPVFGRSTLLGAYAAGTISGGVYTDDGNLTYTASEATCSQQYATISQQPNGGTIHRDAFMKACLDNVNDTAKTDPGP